MDIITKFTVASDKGIDALLFLTRALALEKYSSLLEQTLIDTYITESFNKRKLVTELNSMSSQWLVVYADNNPAGYARVTSTGEKPLSLEHKRAIRIADFAVLTAYATTAIKNSLLEKCLAVCRNYEAVWINEYLKNPFIEFFESKGFVKQPQAARLEELPLQSVYLVLLSE